MWKTTLNDTYAIKPLYLMFRKQHRRGANRVQDPKDRDVDWNPVFSIDDMDLISVKSQRYGCLNKRHFIKSPVNMLILKGEMTLNEELQTIALTWRATYI